MHTGLRLAGAWALLIALSARQELQDAEKAILELLADGQRHHVTELSGIKLPSKAIDEALRNLLAEERITQKDGMLFA